jgi:hypothetical protein
MRQTSTRQSVRDTVIVTVLEGSSQVRDDPHDRRHSVARSWIIAGLRTAARSLGVALHEHGVDILPQGTLGTLRPVPHHAE